MGSQLVTTITFETATLADSVKKAAVVAPSKGAAFDKAAGIVFDVRPSEPDPVTIRATNLDIFYMEIVDTVKAEGEAVTWRLPATLAQVISSFPIGSGKQVTMEQIGNAVRITSGRIKAKMNLITSEYYPSWEPFDPTNLQEVSALGERIKQVAWAASTKINDEPLSGIHFDGEVMVSTDKYRIAMADFRMAVDSPVTIPAAIIGQIVKSMGDTRVGIGGDMMLLMPDEHTQIKARLYGQQFINFKRVTRREQPLSFTCKKEGLLELIARCNTYIGNERFPTLRVFIGEEEIAMLLANETMGLMGDVVEIPGQAQHDRIEVKFLPKYLSDALSASPNDDVTIGYNLDPKQCMLIIDGGSGYKAWVMPRMDTGA